MKTTFNCSIPMIQSAIKVGGDGAIRLQLDIPENEMANAIKVVMGKEKVLTVTVEWEDE